MNSYSRFLIFPLIVCMITSCFFLIGTNSSVLAATSSDSVSIEVSGTIIPIPVWNGLHTDGKMIVNEQGTEVHLRGADFGEISGDDPTFSSHHESDYALMASWGFNVVRLPVSWNYIEPQPGVYNQSYVDTFSRDIAWASKNGMYIILDLHPWGWSDYFTYASDATSGLPVWMVSGYANSAAGEGHAIADFWNGLGPNGTVASASNPSMQARCITMWEYLAQQFANDSNIAAYDMFNEPLYANGYISSTQVAPLAYAFYNNLINDIRTVDSNHILIYEPVGGWDTSTAQLLNQNNIMFSFHSYDATYDGNATELAQNFYGNYTDLPVSNPIINWNIPIFIGEFAIPFTATNAGQWVIDETNIFNTNGWSWCWWSYWKSDNYHYALCYSNGTARAVFVDNLKQGIQ